MKRYLELLRAEPLLRRLSLIQLIAYFGAWFSNVAIYTLLLRLEVSPWVVSLVAALHFLPGVLQAPLSGTLIDRIPPRRLMLSLLAVEIAATLPLTLVGSVSQLWLLGGLVFVRMGASSFYFTLEMALLPRFLKAEKLKLANEIHSVIWSISFTVGMALSGFAVYATGVKTAFVLDALLFAVALLLLSGARFPDFRPAHGQRFGKMMRESLAYLKTRPVLKHLIFLHALVGFTAFDALVPLMTETYYLPAVAAPLAIGLLHAFRALGLVAGPLMLGRRIDNRRLPFVLLFQAAAVFVWAAVLKNFGLSLAASVFVGLATTTLWSYTYTLLQHHTDKAFYGRIIAYNDMVFLLTVAAVSLAIGTLADAGVDLRIVTALLGSAFVAGAFYFRWISKHFRLEEIHGGEGGLS